MDLQSMDEPAMRQWLDSLDRKQLQAEAKLRGVKANSKSSIIVEELLALLLSTKPSKGSTSDDIAPCKDQTPARSKAPSKAGSPLLDLNQVSLSHLAKLTTPSIMKTTPRLRPPCSPAGQQRTPKQIKPFSPGPAQSELSPCLSLGQVLEQVQEKENVQQASMQPPSSSNNNGAAEEGPRRHSSWAQEQEAKAAQLGEELARLQLQGRARLSSNSGLRQSLQNPLPSTEVAIATAREEPAPVESTFKVPKQDTTFLFSPLPSSSLRASLHAQSKGGLTSSGAWLNGLAPLPPPVAPVAASLLSPLRMPARRVTAEAPPALESEVEGNDTVDQNFAGGSRGGPAPTDARPAVTAGAELHVPAAARPLSLSLDEKKVSAASAAPQPVPKAALPASGPAGTRKSLSSSSGAGAKPAPGKFLGSSSAHHAGVGKPGMPHSRGSGPAAAHGSTTGSTSGLATASGQRSSAQVSGLHKPRSFGALPGDTATAAGPKSSSTSGAPAIKPLLLKGITPGTSSKGATGGAAHAGRPGSLTSRAGSASTVPASAGVIPRGAVTARPGTTSHPAGTTAGVVKHGYSGHGHSSSGAAAGSAGAKSGLHKQVQGGATTAAAGAGAMSGKVAPQNPAPAAARNLNDARLEEVVKTRFCLKPGSTSSALVLGMPGTKHKLRQLVRLPRTAVAAAGDASPGGAVVRSVLLFGPQGCGKSELAKAMAAEAGARCYMLDIQILLKAGNLADAAGVVRIAFKMATQPPAGAFIVVDNLHLLAQTQTSSPAEAEACAGIRKELLAAFSSLRSGPAPAPGPRPAVVVLGIACQPYAVDDVLAQAFVNPGKSSPPSSAPHSRAPHSHTSGASAVVPLSPIIPPSPAYDPAEAAAMAALASGSPASLMSEAECEGRAAVVEEGPRMSGGAVYVALPCADTREELLFTQMARHDADLAVDDLEILVKTSEGMSGRDIITSCSAALTIRDKDVASGHLPTPARSTPRATPPGMPGRSGPALTVDHLTRAITASKASGPAALSHGDAVRFLKYKGHLAHMCNPVPSSS